MNVVSLFANIGIGEVNYSFFKIEPKDIALYSQNGKVGTIPFTKYFHAILAGKAYKESDDSKKLILAFEKNTPVKLKK